MGGTSFILIALNEVFPEYFEVKLTNYEAERFDFAICNRQDKKIHFCTGI